VYSSYNLWRYERLGLLVCIGAHQFWEVANMPGDKSAKENPVHPSKKNAVDAFQAEYDSALNLSKEISDHERLALTHMQALPAPTKNLNLADYKNKQEAVVHEMRAAINTADGSQSVANRVFADFLKTREPSRQALAKQFGFDPDKVSDQDIQNKLASGNLNQRQIERLAKLAELQKEWHTLKELQETPAITRVQAAYIKASGKLDAAPSLPLQEQVAVNDRNAKDAFGLLRDAAAKDSSGDLVKSKPFEIVTQAVNKRYVEYQTDLCLQIQGTLSFADQLSKNPSQVAKVIQQYEIASNLAAKVNLNYIAAHQKELGTHGNQKGPLDLRDVYSLVEASSSREAQALISQGQNQKAIPLMVKLMANVPELVKDPNFQAELLRAEIGGSSVKHDPSEHLAKFMQVYFKTVPNESDDDKHDRYTSALIDINAAEKGYRDRNAQLAKSIDAVKAEQQSLELEKKNLAARTDMEKQEKDFALLRVNNELTAAKRAIDLMNVGMDTNRINIADLAYWQGSCFLMRGDTDEAHERFDFAKNNGSNFAKDKKYKLDDLLDSTTWWGVHKGYFKEALIVVAGIAAGIAVGILTSETGPGAIFAGVSTSARVMMALGAGSIATAATTKLVGEPVTLGTWIKGAGLGLGGFSYIFTSAAFAPAVASSATEAEAATAEAASLEARAAQEGLSAEMRSSLQDLAQVAREQAKNLGRDAFKTRMLAGAASGAAYSIPSATGNLINSTQFEHRPAGEAWKDFAVSVGTGTIFGTFTPLSSYKTLLGSPVYSGESTLLKAWSTIPAVGAGLKAGYPILLGPPLETSAVESVLSDIAKRSHKKYDLSFRNPQPHDFSEDTYFELEHDHTVGPPTQSHRRSH
jgi:hypothetical protein